MKKIFQYIWMTVAVAAMASCSNELDEALQPAGNGTLQFVVSDFPAFGNAPQTRVIGTQDEGKTEWKNNDEILVTLTSDYFGVQTASLTYDGSNWSTNVLLAYTPEEEPTVSVIYAPCYEVTDKGVMQLGSGMQLGMTEFLYGNCQMENGTITITFNGAIRNYSRLRIAGQQNQTLTVETNGFTPAGSTSVANKLYTLTTDDKGNAYLYGTFAENATVSVKQDNVTLKEYTFNEETVNNKSYALDANSQ